MTSNQKNSTPPPIKALDQKLIDDLQAVLSKELESLLLELNNSSKIGAFGAMATISTQISEIASDIKKLQHLPNILTNPFVMSDPRAILDEISKKYTKKIKKQSES